MHSHFDLPYTEESFSYCSQEGSLSVSPTCLDPPPRRQDRPGASVGAMAGDARRRHGFPRGRALGRAGVCCRSEPGSGSRPPEWGGRWRSVAGDRTSRWTDSGPLPLPLWKASAEENSIPCSEDPLGKSEPQRHMKELGNGQPYAIALLFS